MAIKWLIKGVDSKDKKAGKAPAGKRGTGNRSKKGKPGKPQMPTGSEESDAELLGGGPPAQFHKSKKQRAPRNGAETKAKRNKKAK